MEDPRRFYRPVLLAGLKMLDHDPDKVIRLDYEAEEPWPGPCLALTLRGDQLMREVALLVSWMARDLHLHMNDAMFKEWMNELDAMLAGLRVNGSVVYFPGWSL